LCRPRQETIAGCARHCCCPCVRAAAPVGFSFRPFRRARERRPPHLHRRRQNDRVAARSPTANQRRRGQSGEAQLQRICACQESSCLQPARSCPSSHQHEPCLPPATAASLRWSPLARPPSRSGTAAAAAVAALTLTVVCGLGRIIHQRDAARAPTHRAQQHAHTTRTHTRHPHTHRARNRPPIPQRPQLASSSGRVKDVCMAVHVVSPRTPPPLCVLCLLPGFIYLHVYSFFFSFFFLFFFFVVYIWFLFYICTGAFLWSLAWPPCLRILARSQALPLGPGSRLALAALSCMS